jgi:membrane fusion protein (multidrug efflux system)
MTLAPTDAMVESFYATRLEGRVDVEIRPQVDGTLQKIFVDEGAYVKRGQPLFQIDDRSYRSAYEAAKASAAVARIEMDKLVPLVQNKVVSPVQLQSAKAKYQAA